MKYATWKGEVDALFIRKVGIDSENLMIGPADLAQAYQTGYSPLDYVDWYIVKYDLTMLSEVGL